MVKRISYPKNEFYGMNECLSKRNEQEKKFISQIWMFGIKIIEGFLRHNMVKLSKKNMTDVRFEWSCPDLSKHDEIHVKKY